MRSSLSTARIRRGTEAGTAEPGSMARDGAKGERRDATARVGTNERVQGQSDSGIKARDQHDLAGISRNLPEGTETQRLSAGAAPSSSRPRPNLHASSSLYRTILGMRNEGMGHRALRDSVSEGGPRYNSAACLDQGHPRALLGSRSPVPVSDNYVMFQTGYSSLPNCAAERKARRR